MNKNKKIIIIMLVSFLVLAVAFIVPSVAKYITENGEQSDINTDNFYFTSNYLKDEEFPTYEIYGNSFSFEINNYIDNLRVNEDDISFVVNTSSGTCNIKNGVLSKNQKQKEIINFSYVFEENENEKEITIEVIGQAKYKKSLKATIRLIKPSDPLKYYIEDLEGSNYFTLCIVALEDVKVNLLWNNGKILIDETNDYIYGTVENIGKSISKAEIKNIKPGVIVKIVFFKKILTDNYSCDFISSNGTISIAITE